MISPVTQGEHRGGETMAVSFKGAHCPQEIIHSDSRPLVCRVPAEYAPHRRAHA